MNCPFCDSEKISDAMEVYGCGTAPADGQYVRTYLCRHRAATWRGSSEQSTFEVRMTLRDWFAGQALTSVPYNAVKTQRDINAVGKYCYWIADAMLAARKEVA